MGDEIFVYLLTGDGTEPQRETAPHVEEPQNQLLMGVDPSSDVEAEQDVEVVLDRERVHLFDTESGEAISHSLKFAAVEPGAAETESEAEGDD